VRKSLVEKSLIGPEGEALSQSKVFALQIGMIYHFLKRELFTRA